MYTDIIRTVGTTVLKIAIIIFKTTKPTINS